MKTIVITGVILLLAWSLGAVIGEVGTADYLVGVLKGAIPAFILPSLIFILGALISFATGTSYGTMSILMPLAIPRTMLEPIDSQSIEEKESRMFWTIFFAEFIEIVKPCINLRNIFGIIFKVIKRIAQPVFHIFKLIRNIVHKAAIFIDIRRKFRNSIQP